MALSDALPAHLLVSVSVRAYLGESGRGPSYAAPVTVPAVWDDGARLVRTGTSSRVTAAAAVLVDLDVSCPPESLVTVPDGRTLKAAAVTRLDAGGLPVDHQEIALT